MIVGFFGPLPPVLSCGLYYIPGVSISLLHHHAQKATNETDGGVSVGVIDDGESTPVSNRGMSKRLSRRDSTSEGDRQLKKLFRAIQDGDTNLVSIPPFTLLFLPSPYLFPLSISPLFYFFLFSSLLPLDLSSLKIWHLGWTISQYSLVSFCV